jgi:hypothetical protein
MPEPKRYRTWDDVAAEMMKRYLEWLDDVQQEKNNDHD